MFRFSVNLDGLGVVCSDSVWPLSFVNWCGDGSCFCPAPSKSGSIRSVAETVFYKPVAEALGSVADSNIDGVPLVPKLSMASCPSAVFGTVVSVVVNAVNLQSFAIRWPHILVKCLKGIPSFAHRYASAAIACIARIVRVVTSGSDAFPDSVNSCVRHPVGGESLARHFILEAAAASTVARPKICCRCPDVFPTRTFAEGFPWSHSYREASDGESPVSLADCVSRFHASIIAPAWGMGKQKE